jgi:hypothetical protein
MARNPVPSAGISRTASSIRFHERNKMARFGFVVSEVPMLRQRIGNWLRMAALGAAVTLAFGTVAWGQSWGYNNDDDYYRRHDEARQHGYRNGYRDGQRAGQYDADRGRRLKFKNDDWEDSRGFERWMGNKHDYKHAYRKGYERGYRETYNSYGYRYRDRDRYNDRWRDRNYWR